MATRDPYPFLHQVLDVIPSKDVLPMDLEDPKVWTRPTITDCQYLVLHWGGGPNAAGWGPVEEPMLTWTQKLKVHLGLIKGVLTSWMKYHMSQGQSTIAYSSAIGTWRGRLIKLRGHRANGGQWGTINSITHAAVFVMGLGQTASKRAWQTLGLLWFALGGPRLVGHLFFNNWPQSQTTTSCPGKLNNDLIGQEYHITALGMVRWRRVRLQRGRVVRAITCRLAELGYPTNRVSAYTNVVESCVLAFQRDHGLKMDGIVGPNTWKALAKA